MAREKIPLEVPHLGERGDVPSHRLPPGALAVLQNMLRNSEGRLILRPGYDELAAAGPGTRIMGLAYYKTAASADRTVAVTRTGAWQYASAVWTDITGNALTGGTTDEPRFAVFPEGTPIVYNLLICNNVDAPKVWNGAAATYSDLGGSPPVFADIAVVGNRVLGLLRPNTLRVSEFNNSASWPAGNSLILADSGDLMVGMGRLNRTAVGIYGETSQWIVKSQPGTFPVRPEWVSDFPGPISARAIVKYGDRNYWLAEDANVYVFDGVQTQAVGYAMKPFVQENLNYLNRRMSHGVFLSKFDVIAWIFPSVASSAPDIGIYLNVKTGEMGRLLFATSITASSVWTTVSLVPWNSLGGFTWNNIAGTYPTWESFGGAAAQAAVLGDVNGQVHMFDFGDGSDDGSAIEGIWEFGLLPAGGLDKNFRPETFETFFRRSQSAVTIETWVGTTDTLMTDRTLSAAANIDISVDQRNDINLAPLDLENRFVTIRHRASSTVGNVEWLGGLLRGDPAGISAGPTS